MHNKIIMLVENDDSLREAIVETLISYQYKVVDYKKGIDALSDISTVMPSLVISDVNMDGIDGISLMKSIHRKYSSLPVILITAYGTVEKAVAAIKLGACDYLLKPFEPEALIKLIDKHSSSQQSDKDLDMIATDDVSIRLVEMARRVAKSDATVMITGESGTGKEVLSKFIHNNSPRKEKPFITINCAAIPDNMLESILFGYEKGAYTGAYKASPGKFELAQGGTILLDEISEMDILLQAKILRVLQEREVERLGSKKVIKLDVRVIATSNRNLKKEVAAGNFREDLYYRLNVFPLVVPRLSERRMDILPLANIIIEKWARLYHSNVNSISAEAMHLLTRHSWPGNVRELDNVLQRAIILTDSSEIIVDNLKFDNDELYEKCSDTSSEITSEVSIKENEYQLIAEVLASVSWSRKKASTKLGISERTLRYKMSRMKESGYEIQPAYAR